MTTRATTGSRLLALAFCVAAMAAFSTTATAQVMDCTTEDGTRYCVVAPGFGTLNEAVHGDTTSTGARVDENTWYVLQRDGLYLLNGSVENRGFHLKIMGERGEGHPPIVQPGVSEVGSSDLAFSVRGDLTTKGFYVTHLDDAGGIQLRTYRIRTDEATVRLDSMFLDTEGQAYFRTDGEGTRLFITNSHLRNAVFLTSPANGRIIDTRGNSPDTLWFENNTMYHYSHDIIRAAGAILPFVYFNHNTVYNGGAQLDIERAVKAVVTNNLFINPATDWTQEDAEDGVGFIFIDSLRAENLTEADRSIVVTNNNFYYEDDWLELYSGIDTVMVRPLLSEWGEFLAANNPNIVVENNISSAVAFADAPASDTYIAFRSLLLTDPGNENPPDFRADKNGVFDAAGLPVVGIGELPYDFDFSYPTTEPSYTAAEGGFPLGDLNWFPAQKLEWIATSTGETTELPTRLRVHGNYPNPFNPSTSIRLDLPTAADVSVAVFDLLGRKVLEVPAQAMPAGPDQSIRLDAGALASGVYVYQVTARSAARSDVSLSTGRMVLLK